MSVARPWPPIEEDRYILTAAELDRYQRILHRGNGFEAAFAGGAISQHYVAVMAQDDLRRVHRCYCAGMKP